MATKDLKVNDVVQIDPEHDPVFGACLMVVTEPKTWGAQGYVLVPHAGGAKQAFYRCPHEHMELIGPVVWADRESPESPAPGRPAASAG